jgi:hypothetical protein
MAEQPEPPSAPGRLTIASQASETSQFAAGKHTPAQVADTPNELDEDMTSRLADPAEAGAALAPDVRIERLLDALRDGLVKADRLFQAGEKGGREGAIHGVKSVLKFLTQIPQIGDQGLTAPLLTLVDALMNLDDGRTQPMLLAARKSGRARAGAIRECHKGAVAFTVARLQGAGMLRDEALAAVAKTLERAGFAPSRGRHPVFTPRTIRGWCEKVAEDVGCHGEAAETCRQLDGAIPEGLAGQQACDAYLAMLIDQFRRVGDGGVNPLKPLS